MKISLKVRLLLPLCLLTILARVGAQPTAITQDTPVTTEGLQQWLNSADPREVAWAADFARRTNNEKVIAEMPAVLEQVFVAPGRFGYDVKGIPVTRATLAVLDALVQSRTSVPQSTIRAIAHSFPAQVAILVSRLPREESRETLLSWTNEFAGNDTASTLSRVAAMMLAKDPDPAFVAGIVNASEERLSISILEHDGFGSAMGRSSDCGAAFVVGPTPGWPRVYNYTLFENDPNGGDSSIVDLDGDRISFKREEDSNGCGYCPSVAPLNPETRHRLIAYWLGVKDNAMAWMPNEYESIVWRSHADYEKQLGRVIERHFEQLRATVETLHQRGLLTDQELDMASPRLLVTVRCEMTPCPLGPGE